MDKEILLVILAVLLFGLVMVNIGFGMYLVSSDDSDELVRIKLVGHIEEDYKETNRAFESHLVCDLRTGNCGNDIYYQDGKGFYWLGLQNISGLRVEARLMDYPFHQQGESHGN